MRNAKVEEALDFLRRQEVAKQADYARWLGQQLRGDPVALRLFMAEAFDIKGGVGPVWRKLQTAQANSATCAFSAATAGSLMVAFCQHDAATAPTTPSSPWKTGFAASTASNARSGRISYARAAGGETSVVFTGTLTTPKTIFGEYVPLLPGLNLVTLTLGGNASVTASGTVHTTNSISPTAGWIRLLAIAAVGLRINTTATWSAEALSGANVETTTEDLDQGGQTLYSCEAVVAASSYSGSATASTALTGVTGVLFAPGFTPKNVALPLDPACF